MWPTAWLEPRERQLHVATAQFGLGCFERYLARRRRRMARDGDRGRRPPGRDPGRRWRLGARHRDAATRYWLAAAVALGDGAGRGREPAGPRRTGDRRGALRGGGAAALWSRCGCRSREGGARAELDGGFFLEEYPTDPPSYVLNGAIFALWGCRDVAIGLADPGAAELYEEGVETLAANLHRFDTGFWSLYDLFPHPVRNVASGAYHRLHINQLRALQLVSPRPEFAAAAERFARYEASRLCRRRALAQKVAFRLVVPRNERLALRLPWAHRPEHGEVLVLCYHSVSDDWPSRLAVTGEPAAPSARASGRRAAIGGSRSATRSSSPPTAEPRVAVTFDDGYASLEANAAPILDELGLPGDGLRADRVRRPLRADEPGRGSRNGSRPRTARSSSRSTGRG